VLASHYMAHILVCNDDGIFAPGIKALVEAVKEFGTLTVVAPDSPQSGMGHAISVGKPIWAGVSHDFGPDVKAWETSGTPADCIKIATGQLMDKRPDLIVSGINHGSNSSISVFYSGTMSAAIEGVLEGIPSIGFSLLDYSMEADFAAAKQVVRTIVRRALAHRMPENVALNVNIPKLPAAELRGIKITRQSAGRWVEEFDKRKDPYGRDYYWLMGQFDLQDDGQDTDGWALRNGYVSVCPVQIDVTAHHALARLNNWEMNEIEG